MIIYKYGNSQARTVLVQPVGDHDLPGIEKELLEIQSLTEMEVQLLAVKVDNWNHDLSPWAVPAVFGGENFGGGIILVMGGISDQSVCRRCSGLTVALVSGFSGIYEKQKTLQRLHLSEPWRQRRKDQASCDIQSR